MGQLPINKQIHTFSLSPKQWHAIGLEVLLFCAQNGKTEILWLVTHLFLQGWVCKDDNGEFLDVLLVELSGEGGRGHVTVQLGQLGHAGLGAVFTNIALREVELGAKVTDHNLSKKWECI